MNVITGIDACPGGWLAISRDLATGELISEVHRDISSLVQHKPRPVILAIDIPIGLTYRGPRACDVLARKMLGQPRGSSVFPAPIRPALYAASHQQASEITRSIDAKGVSIQAWGIFPRIREVDEALQEDPLLQRTVYEVHPEVSFMQWNKGIAIAAAKKTAEGKAVRAQLVDSHFGPGAFPRVREAYPKRIASDDDINDAFAALWTAERIYQGTARPIPDPPERDPTGLQMCMWY